MVTTAQPNGISIGLDSNPTIAGSNNSSKPVIHKPIPQNGERHTLEPETELRIEIPANTNGTVTLLAGSAEIFGAELPLALSSSSIASSLDASSSDKMYNSKQSVHLSGNTKFAIYTWHGCTLDIDIEFGKSLAISYTSSETSANISYVNTHAQLEAIRDEVLGDKMNVDIPGSGTENKNKDGPRVLLVGPADSGKTSLARVLTSYAVKLGRMPILVDLDVSQNMLSVPGTISASPMTQDSISASTNAASGNTIASGMTSLVLWYGSTDISSNPDLYKAQLDKLGKSIDARISSGATSRLGNVNSDSGIDERASGLIINTAGWIEDIGYELLLHAADALRVNVILVMGHDRLYSMLRSHFSKVDSSENETANSSSSIGKMSPKVIKLPRSGGVVSRDTVHRRISRSLCTKRYFNGNMIRNASGKNSDVLVNQYTPTLLELNFSDLNLYKLSSVTLAASMLPVSAKQATDPVQLKLVDIGPALKHGILAVCHPSAVAAYKESGRESDLYLSGVAGFVAVEKVNVDREILSLLSPCAGALPSNTLLVGDIVWME